MSRFHLQTSHVFSLPSVGKGISGSPEGCAYELAALRAAQHLLQASGLLESLFGQRQKHPEQFPRIASNCTILKQKTPHLAARWTAHISWQPSGLAIYISNPFGLLKKLCSSKITMKFQGWRVGGEYIAPWSIYGSFFGFKPKSNI